MRITYVWKEGEYTGGGPVKVRASARMGFASVSVTLGPLLGSNQGFSLKSVSYTHLTLPTN